MIGIRVDANEIIASGHILRCITIAKEIEKHGETVLFFLADEYGSSFLKESDFDYIVLGTLWNQPKQEIEILAHELIAHKIETVLFDSYQFDAEYFSLLRSEFWKENKEVRFCYIDDLFEDVYPVDMIINYNAYCFDFPYYEKYAKNVQLLLGPKYVPLREEFSRTNYSTKDIKENQNKRHVLLSCGGGDTLQVMKEILSVYIDLLNGAGIDCSDDEKQIAWSDIVWHVVVGRFTTDKDALFELGQCCCNIEIHYDINNMAELMGMCDMAVSAAGTMLYELCAMQCPTVFFITADNQRYDSSFFASDERMLDAGDVRADREACIRKILEGIQLMLTNQMLYDTMKDKLVAVTDGKGAEKIAKVICMK